MSLVLRPGRPADAERCGEICFRAFEAVAQRHGFEPDLPSPAVAVAAVASLLARPDVDATVAELDGRVVGSNFMWRAAPVVGVGPLTVDPEARDASVGRRLMEHLLASAAREGFAGVRLVQAAYNARSLALYTKLGFDVREALVCVQGPPIGACDPECQVRAATAGDVEACTGLCVQVHALDRAEELRSAVLRGTATVVERAGRITGYATSIGFLGHAVASSDQDLQALIAAAPCIEGLGLLLPLRASATLRWCLEHGLRVVEPLTLMTRGVYSEPAGAWLPSIVY